MSNVFTAEEVRAGMHQAEPQVMPPTMSTMHYIVANGYVKVHWPASQRLSKAHRVVVDAQTAAAVIAVYNFVTGDNKQKVEHLIALGPDKLAAVASLAWR